ncbi:FAD-dependent oxidoreductase [Phytohabitans sp. ZYX-F-186]|uniref:FAD-dependent oxidoreductase n=1 Tax=Phytohabitans maris TaxID=3071409 RepID=A0ABU0ZWI7_9ACTN|nr:FAD-dependent oxidoreductase [Phytohabitans sp. ZYX-F-186]MDQ7911290.1 FAD-dependent oxidoreductase [Phytohabitans sp. ZYX-F-186]
MPRQHIQQTTQVLVVGAGSAGVAAAVTAAESGAQTLLVEASGHVGGTLARQLLEHSAGFHDTAGNQVTGGVGQRIVTLLREYGGTPGHIPDDVAYTASRTPVNHAELSMCEAILLRRAGVRLLLHTAVVDVGTGADGRTVQEVTAETPGHGRITIRPAVVVDCSGDAVVFALAGAAFQDDQLRATQPASLLLKLGGVDFGPLLEYARAHPDDFRPGSRFGEASNDHLNMWGFGKLLARGHDKGVLSWPRTELHLAGWPSRGEAVLNLTRTRTAPGDLGGGEVYLQLAQQVMEAVAWFREYVPGGRRAYLADVADRTGVRESRRILGRATLTRDDVVGARRAADSIGQGAFPIDIHDAAAAGLSHTESVPTSYDIPYSILVARDITNLLAAGRCVSTTHEANGSVRITATCFTTGEAAGAAAALAVRDRATTGTADTVSANIGPDADSVDVGSIDVAELQALLRSRGAIGAR